MNISSRRLENHWPGTSHQNVSPKAWYSLVSEYTRLNITYEQDLLPALSGIAKKVRQSRPGDVYLAGLWGDTLLRDLVWYLGASRKSSRRPSKWRAPSWSWASLDGAIVYQDLFPSFHLLELHTTLVDASVTLAGVDPTGGVTAGQIILDGPLFDVELYVKDRILGGFPRYYVRGNSLDVRFTPDCSGDLHDGTLRLGDRLACLRVATWKDRGQGSSDMSVYLALKLISDGSTTQDRLPTYRRVAHIVGDEEFGGKSTKAPTRRIKII